MSSEFGIDFISSMNVNNDLCFLKIVPDFIITRKGNFISFMHKVFKFNHQYLYFHSAKKIVMKLKEIERVDPIGFNVYLTKKNV